MNENVLDNPAWAALTTAQAHFAEGGEDAKRYQESILPFAAIRTAVDGSAVALDAFINKGEAFFLIGEVPALPASWTKVLELPCAQMVLRREPPASSKEPVDISLLGEADADDMLALVNLVQPGYYRRDSRMLGNYYGIRQEGRLVAIAGERMRPAGFSELSAICTHPEYTGRGYAQQLMVQICRRHAAEGIVSFLHVALTNERAIRLYEHMGFEQRRVINFHKFVKE
ncbi:GNAT family N-acetyltransferase [Chitinophaga solisilvae]|uniref:GNAT family N-acetyltransferase n=1 Tax=Chitinophaga solisilvae TaxID=1233460 RepID=UPI00136BA10E|nr:GNAT family N-acetyltransferase [Chitinophaga solisilvae]